MSKKVNKEKTTAVINQLVKRSFKNNRTRNIVAIIAIVLTTLMFTSLFVLSQSITQNLQQMNIQQAGTKGHISFKYVKRSELEEIKSHENIKSWGESFVVGIAENDEFVGQTIEIRYADPNFAELSLSTPTTGKLPEAYDEIALDTSVLDKLGVPHELGQTVTLKYREDFTKEEYVEKTFKVSGIWQGNEGSISSITFVSKAFIDQEYSHIDQEIQDSSQVLGVLMLSVELKKMGDLEESAKMILEDAGCPDVNFGVNWAYDKAIQNSNFLETIPMYLGMIMVFASGYLIIFNIFQISVASDIRFYGKLKTLGTTAKQIKKILYGQANILCVIGIPIGLLLGYLLGSVLVPYIIVYSQNAQASANPLIFIGSAVFAYITVLISCLQPAKLAGKVSPMEALRYTDNNVNSKKKTKKSTTGASILQMAFANLGRNKKRTITVICSLTLGLVLLTCFYAKNKSFDINKYMAGVAVSDYAISDKSLVSMFDSYDQYGTTISPDLRNKIEALADVENTGYLYSNVTEIILPQSVVDNIVSFYEKDGGEPRKFMEEVHPTFTEAYTDMQQTGNLTAEIYGLEGVILDELEEYSEVLEGEIDREKLASGNYIIAKGIETDEDSSVQQPTYQIGDTVEIDGRDFEVMALIDSTYVFTEGSPAEENGLYLGFFIHGSIFKEMYPDNTPRKMFFNTTGGSSEAVEAFLEDYKENVDSGLPITSRKTIEESYKNQTRASNLMGIAISIIIALVGILNFINSMFTAIISRQKEFAMIQSVGMTKKQLRKMLIMEGMSYALLTLAASFVLGSLGVAVGVRAMLVSNWTSTYQFTIMPLFICTPVLLAFAVIIPFICFKNIEKQSIVERLRLAE